MKKTKPYKGYIGVYEYDQDRQLFVGRLVPGGDKFSAVDKSEIEAEFRKAVDRKEEGRKKEMNKEVVDSYEEIEYKGHKIAFGYMADFGAWIATGKEIYIEGYSPEEVVEKAKLEIDKKEGK